MRWPNTSAAPRRPHLGGAIWWGWRCLLQDFSMGKAVNIHGFPGENMGTCGKIYEIHENPLDHMEVMMVNDGE